MPKKRLGAFKDFMYCIEHVVSVVPYNSTHVLLVNGQYGEMHSVPQ